MCTPSYKIKTRLHPSAETEKGNCQKKKITKDLPILCGMEDVGSGCLNSNFCKVR